MPSITAACHFLEEHNALPGWLETHAPFFDELLLVDCGPGGKPSRDGSLDLLRDWGIEPVQWAIDEGFGVIRTRLAHAAKTEWVMIMDADERFHPFVPTLTCTGDETYPETPCPNLVTAVTGVLDQGLLLRELIHIADLRGDDALALSRRHWFTLGFSKPTQNWTLDQPGHGADWQLRLLRNAPHVGYRQGLKMHEQAIDFRTGGPLRYLESDRKVGLHLDHYHLVFKKMEPEQRAADIRIYDALDRGGEVPIA